MPTGYIHTYTVSLCREWRIILINNYSNVDLLLKHVCSIISFVCIQEHSPWASERNLLFMWSQIGHRSECAKGTSWKVYWSHVLELHVCVCVYLLTFWTSVYPCSVKSLSSCTAVANVIEITGHKSTSIGHLYALQLPTSVVTAHCSYCRNETLVYTGTRRSVC